MPGDQEADHLRGGGGGGRREEAQADLPQSDRGARGRERLGSRDEQLWSLGDSVPADSEVRKFQQILARSSPLVFFNTPFRS